MHIAQAQADQRRAFANGGLGAVVSGLVWLVAGIVLARADLATAYATLFFGGFLIFPLGLFVARVILKLPKETPGNPLIKVVPECTIAMVAFLFIAWLLVDIAPDIVLPAAVLAVGTHYFPFQTAYGLKVYWLLGAVTTGLGLAALFTGIPQGPTLMWAMAAIEIAFGLYLSFAIERSDG